MTSLLNLDFRLSQLEKILEGKQDQERLKEFLGDEYYDKYNLIKNKISDPQYKDIYKLLKMDLDDVKEYIDSFKSSTTKRSSKKLDGAKLIYNKNGWKVYRITTYDAAVLYGSHTTWCITGRYNGAESRGLEYFNDYIKDYNLDGGYYFYIKNNNEKYCLLRTVNGTIHSVWDEEDNKYNLKKLLDVAPDFPDVPGVADISSFSKKLNAYKLLLNDKDIKAAIDYGININDVIPTGLGAWDGEHPIEYFYRKQDISMVKKLLKYNADCTDPEIYSMTFLDQDIDTLRLFTKYGLNPKDILFYEEPILLYYTKKLNRMNSSSDINYVYDLIDLGADINAVDEKGNTPLIYAAKYDNLNVVKRLLDKGADLKHKNNARRTAISLATGECKEFLKTLI